MVGSFPKILDALRVSAWKERNSEARWSRSSERSLVAGAVPHSSPSKVAVTELTFLQLCPLPSSLLFSLAVSLQSEALQCVRDPKSVRKENSGKLSRSCERR